MPACNSDADGKGREALLALKQNKSPSSRECPTPRPGWAAEIVDATTGEIELKPLGCRRNTCSVCRRRNVQETAAKLGINQALTETPVTHAVLSTTRNWADAKMLRNGWKDFARRVRSEVKPDARYAWVREFTERDATEDWKRTHYHSTWALDDDDQAQRVAEISNQVWGRLTGAVSEEAHGWKSIWDAGGLVRYMAGLIGHHLKTSQQPIEQWRGRRYGTSVGFYAIDSRELDKQARAAVRDERLVHHLERDLWDVVPDGLPEWIFDEVLTERVEQARSMPPPRIVPVAYDRWLR
jgi:hypothetical protein